MSANTFVAYATATFAQAGVRAQQGAAGEEATSWNVDLCRAALHVRLVTSAAAGAAQQG
jgi:hypothetical protein